MDAPGGANALHEQKNHFSFFFYEARNSTTRIKKASCIVLPLAFFIVVVGLTYNVKDDDAITLSQITASVPPEEDTLKNEMVN